MPTPAWLLVLPLGARPSVKLPLRRVELGLALVSREVLLER